MYIHVYIARKMKSKCVRNRIVSDVNKLRKLAEMNVFFASIMANNLTIYPNEVVAHVHE